MLNFNYTLFIISLIKLSKIIKSIINLKQFVSNMYNINVIHCVTSNQSVESSELVIDLHHMVVPCKWVSTEIK